MRNWSTVEWGKILPLALIECRIRALGNSIDSGCTMVCLFTYTGTAGTAGLLADVTEKNGFTCIFTPLQVFVLFDLAAPPFVRTGI